MIFIRQLGSFHNWCTSLSSRFIRRLLFTPNENLVNLLAASYTTTAFGVITIYFQRYFLSVFLTRVKSYVAYGFSVASTSNTICIFVRVRSMMDGGLRLQPAIQFLVNSEAHVETTYPLLCTFHIFGWCVMPYSLFAVD